MSETKGKNYSNFELSLLLELCEKHKNEIENKKTVKGL